MPMTDAQEATKKFMEDLDAGKFKMEKVPNPPPYFEGTKEEIEEETKSFDKFLKSDLFEYIKNLT